MITRSGEDGQILSAFWTPTAYDLRLCAADNAWNNYLLEGERRALLESIFGDERGNCENISFALIDRRNARKLFDRLPPILQQRIADSMIWTGDIDLFKFDEKMYKKNKGPR